MCRPLPCLVFVLLLPGPLVAHAFSVSSHEALTRAALDAVRGEQGPSPLESHRAVLLRATQAEDLNLQVKWTSWNHFHHPGSSLNSWFRQDSSARVRALWAEAEQAASRGDLAYAFNRVGHLVHHIQDMASPPHVVPVMHGLGDRFEQCSLSARALARAPLRRLAPLSGTEAHEALARETLEAVRTGSLAVQGGSLPWSAFWAEAPPASFGAFGTYGEAGNSFGQAQVHWHGRTWTVEPERYQDFLDARTDAAVAYSRVFLLWAEQRLLALAAAHVPLARTGPWVPAAQLSFEVMGGGVTTPRGTRPVMGARVHVPLPRAFAFSMSYAQVLRSPLLSGREEDGSWALSLLSPPLLKRRLGELSGVSLRALVGGGLSYEDDDLQPELPVGLRVQVQVGTSLLIGAEVQHRLFSPATGPWAHGVIFTGSAGFTWGDD